MSVENEKWNEKVSFFSFYRFQYLLYLFAYHVIQQQPDAQICYSHHNFPSDETKRRRVLTRNDTMYQKLSSEWLAATMMAAIATLYICIEHKMAKLRNIFIEFRFYFIFSSFWRSLEEIQLKLKGSAKDILSHWHCFHINDDWFSTIHISRLARAH